VFNCLKESGALYSGTAGTLEREKVGSREAPMHNLELKVRCTDEAHLDRLIDTARATGAIYTRTLVQRDTYFAAPRGRLKLREWHQPAPPGEVQIAATDAEAEASGATLIAYARPDDAGSRLSDYLLSAVPEPAALRAVLERSIGLRVVVEKHRVLYMWGYTRIHFDRVTALGAFVELETLLDRFATPKPVGDPRNGVQRSAEAEHEAVIAALGLDRLPVIAGSYSDLLLEKNEQ
jgi:adenylate cyclase class IV